MFNPLGAVSALGSGAMEGIGTGMDLRDKYATMMGNQLAIQALSGINGMSSVMPAGGSFAPTPSGDSRDPLLPPPAPPQPAGGAPPGGGSMFGGMPGWAPGERPIAMGAAPGAGPPRPQMAPGQPMPGSAPVMPMGMTPGSATAGMPPRVPQQPPQPPPRPQPTGTAEQQETAQGGQATPHQWQDFVQNGTGFMQLKELATRIHLANPGAAPDVKFKALQAASKLLNANGSQQFNQLMQIAGLKQREEHFQEGQRRADARLQMQMAREQRLSPEGVAATQQAKQQVSALIGPAREALKQSTVQYNAVETKEKSLMTQMDVLGKISGKLYLLVSSHSILGLPRCGWKQETRRPPSTKHS